MSTTGSWVKVFETSTDYEAEIVRDRLDDAGLRAVVDTRRDHAFNLTVGDLARVFVLVPPEEEAEARAILASPPVSDADLVRAALDADPDIVDLGREDDAGSGGDDVGDEDARS